MRALLTVTALITMLGVAPIAAAAPGLVYRGTILKPDGTRLLSATVQFKIQIRSPGAESCLLFEEIQNADLSGTAGTFAIQLNTGAGTRTDSSGYSLDRIFDNKAPLSFTSGQCISGTSYTPQSGDARKLAAYFKDETMSRWEAIPTTTIQYVPMALQAREVAGFGAGSLVRVQDANGAMGSVNPITSAQYNEFVSLVSGTSTQYQKSGQLNGNALPTLAANESFRWNGSSWEAFTPGSTAESDPTVSSFAKSALPVCGAGQFLKDNGSGALTCAAVNAGTVGGTTIINTSGAITTSSTITGSSVTSTSSSSKSYVLWDSDSTNKITLQTPATATLTADYTLTLPADDGIAGQVLSTDGAGVLSWTAPSSGLPASAGTAAAPGYAFSGNTNSGMFGAAANQIGFATNGAEVMRIDASGKVGIGTTTPTTSLDLSSKTDAVRLPAGTTAQQPGTPANGMIRYNSQTNKFEAYENGGWTNMIGLSGTVGVANGGTGATSLSANQLLLGNGSSAVSSLAAGSAGQILRSAGAGAPAWSTVTFPGTTAGAGKILRSDGTNFVETTATFPASSAGAGKLLRSSGTNFVESTATIPDTVAANSLLYGASANAWSELTAPASTSVLLTAAGTNVPTWTTGANNQVLRGGAAGAAFGALVAADIPSLDAAKITTGTVASARLGSGTADNTTFLRGDGTWAAPTGSGDFKSDGSVAMTAALVHATGTAAAPGLTFSGDTNTGIFGAAADQIGFATTGSERLRIDASGNVGIGTTSPASKLDVLGTANIMSTTTYGANVSLTSSGTTGNHVLIRGGNTNNGGGGASVNVYGGGGASNMFGGDLNLTGGGTGYNNQPLLVGKVQISGGADGNNANYGSVLLNSAGGNVGVGTTSPVATLDVRGTILSKPATSNASSTIDFSSGNIQYTSSSCGTFQFNNMKDGGNYTFAVQGATSATCAFTAYTDTGTVPNQLTVHMPPDHGPSTASKHTLYSMIVAGSHLYVAWTPGY